jgi:hypothetical protein
MVIISHIMHTQLTGSSSSTQQFKALLFLLQHPSMFLLTILVDLRVLLLSFATNFVQFIRPN